MGRTTRRALGLLCALGLCLGLAACGRGAAEPSTAPRETQAQGEEQTLQATLNRVDSELGYLVLVTEEGDFYKLDLNGTDVSGLEPGDAVTAAYTGTLSTDEEGEDLSAQLVSIQKD